MATTPVFPMTPPWTPELLPEVAALVETRLRSRPHAVKLLEFGAGWSTVWLAGLDPDWLISYEDDLGWCAEVNKALAGVGQPFRCLLTPGEKMADRAGNLVDGCLDLAYVDCGDAFRPACTLAAVPKLRPDGWLVLDDSHWYELQGVCGELIGLGFRMLNRAGEHVRKTGERKHHSTSIFCREGF